MSASGDAAVPVPPPTSAWTSVPVTVLDFEGTKASGILEWGAVTVQGGAIVETATGLGRAVGPVARRDRLVHGLAGDEAPEPFGTTADHARFAAWRAAGVLAAHHAPVEDALLRTTWPVAPLAPDPAGGPPRASWGPWLDTRRLARAAWPTLPSASLGDVVGALGLAPLLVHLASARCPPTRRRWHCALHDALASALVLLALAEDAAWARLTMAELLGRTARR